LEFAHKLNSPNLKVPPVVFAKPLISELCDPGVIIFEDFTKTTSMSAANDLSIECLKEVVKALADLHAACLLTKDYSSKWHFPSYNRLNLTQLMRAVFIFKNANPVLFGQTFDRIHEIIEEILRIHYDSTDKHKRDSGPEVLVHGYLLPENIRWKKPENPEHSVSELAYIINWQNLRLGTVTEDLVYFLCSSTSSETRRAAIHELIKHYIARFEQKYEKSILELINREFRFQALRALIPLAECLAPTLDTHETSAAGAHSVTQMTVLMRAKGLLDDIVRSE
uniref:CHK domain-containing protein n=1 Tax=Gongylonema pulchrum TaxID=637853 RepID=A0A183ELA1_9BILA